MASSAIPLVFPPVRLNREYFGDGMVRFLAPISPALHLGADKVLIVGVDAVKQEERKRVAAKSFPTLAEVAGHVLDSVFVDSLDSDMERLQRINNTITKIGPDLLKERGIPLRPVETLVIAPSEDLAPLSGKHARSLPRTVRFFFARIGISRKTGSSILSYLLFERSFTQELIKLGYNDAMHQKDEILKFFGVTNTEE